MRLVGVHQWLGFQGSGFRVLEVNKENQKRAHRGTLREGSKKKKKSNQKFVWKLQRRKKKSTPKKEKRTGKQTNYRKKKQEEEKNVQKKMFKVSPKGEGLMFRIIWEKGRTEIRKRFEVEIF